jgi:hypothetical protein
MLPQATTESCLEKWFVLIVGAAIVSARAVMERWIWFPALPVRNLGDATPASGDFMRVASLFHSCATPTVPSAEILI